MSLHKRGEIWYYSISVNGQRVRESTHTTDKKKAQAIHDACRLKLQTQKESGKTLIDAFKLWLKHSERTASEKSALRVALEKYPSRPLSQVSGHDLQDALSYMTASTYNRIANNIRSALNMAHQRSWCESILIPRKKEKNTKTRFLSKAEWQRLENELADHIKPMAKFSISTGLRQANVFNLKWSEVDLDRGVAWVDSPDTKGNKSIPVPLSQYAIDVLTAQQGKHKEYVFIYKENPVGSVKTSWAKALKRAEIKDFRWHDLRHTWASWHIQNGTPLAVLKELGGWHDISMVMRYAHLSPEHLTQYAGNSQAK